MYFDIQLRLKPSEAFIGILAELNDQFSDWTDSSCDWANQTVDFLHALAPLPRFDEAVFQTPLSRRAINDLLQGAIVLPAGNYLPVRDYRNRYGDPQLDRGPFMVQDRVQEGRRWIERGDGAVRAVTEAWSNLGLRFSALSLK